MRQALMDHSIRQALADVMHGMRTPLNWPIAVFLAMIPVSLWVTFDLRLTLAKAVGLLAGLVLFYATVAYVRADRRFTRALAVYLLMGTGLATLGLAGTAWLYKNPLLSSIALALPQWIRGVPGAPQGFHPNEIGGALLWFVPLQLALVTWAGKTGRLRAPVGVALCAAAVVTFLALLLTQSRGAWLGLGVGLLVMGAWLDTRVRLLAVALVLVAVAVLALQGTTRLNSALSMGIAPQVMGESNWDFRLGVWRAALWGIADFPITGMGLGTFRAARRMYPLPAMPADYDFGHAHNGFLQAASDFGLPGLIAYTAMWALSGWMVMSSLRQAQHSLPVPRDTALFWSALGFQGCLVSSFVFNWTDTIALGAKGGVPWWMLLGLIVSLFRKLCRGVWVGQDGA
jgi:O-antigen ligase